MPDGARSGAHPPTRGRYAEAGVALRPATAEDLVPVRRLLADAGLPDDGLADQFPAGYAVAEGPEGTVGAAGVEVHGDDGLLRSVVVESSWRGTGLGWALVADRTAWAERGGLRALFLLTTTAPDFFRGAGFEPVERDGAPPAIRASREFASVCPGTSVLMRRGLPRAPDRSSPAPPSPAAPPPPSGG
jgi:N-acetylglutamate synthase-like GNAT family acetyltransferase